LDKVKNWSRPEQSSLPCEFEVFSNLNPEHGREYRVFIPFSLFSVNKSSSLSSLKFCME
jgi:hypothetical protein